MRPLIPLAAALLVACAGAAPEPATEALGPVPADLVALPNTIEQNGIEVDFVDGVPEAKARLILTEPGRTIPLLESERYRRSGLREERPLAYRQAASHASISNAMDCRRSLTSRSTTPHMLTNLSCGSPSKPNGVRHWRQGDADEQRPRPGGAGCGQLHVDKGGSCSTRDPSRPALGVHVPRSSGRLRRRSLLQPWGLTAGLGVPTGGSGILRRPGTLVSSE